MKIDNVKDAVRLRTKKLANGTESIYLDIYVDGKRKYEYLKLYLVPGKENKAKNKDTLKLASSIKAQRMVEIQTGRFGLEEKEDVKMGIIEWFESLREDVKETKSLNYYYTTKSVILHLRNFLNNKDVLLKDVDKKFVKKFIKYLRTNKTYRGEPLGRESLYTYYMRFCIGLNKAVKEELIPSNPCDLVPSDEKPTKGETTREYLTLDELKLMIGTECKYPMVKKCFLLSCFTGLRYIDIVSLRWKDIKAIDDGIFQIEIVQQKTKQIVTVPLSENALQWLPDRNGAFDDEKVFKMPERSVGYDFLHRWTENAGIKKKVTFHVGRHTYATLLLFYGADLYTVSKLLGHKSVKTTQIYAKVMDETKRKAVNLIPQIL